MNRNLNNYQTLLDVIDDSFGIDRNQLIVASEELRKLKNSISNLQLASASEIDKIRDEIKNDRKEAKIFRLFGTSGIRGIVKNVYSDVVREYVEHTWMSPKLAYYYGRAYGWMMSELKMETKVRINMDPRPSSISMATAVCEGLLEEGVNVFFNGVASTPMGSLYENSIIITASHNEVRFNGIKAFISGIPISFDMEWLIEAGFRLLDRLEKKAKTAPGKERHAKIFVSAAETHTKYLRLGRNIIAREKLGEYDEKGEVIKSNLLNTIMPLDLAFGSAGAHILLNTSVHNNISPQLKLLLETGIIIIGYGAERDGNRTNYKIGAAYPYGETPDIPEEGELEAFARGEYGYGDDRNGGHVSRSFYFPGRHTFKDNSLKKEAIVVDSVFVFVDVDNPSKKDLLLKLIEEIKELELLPACSVDCDEDRFLATSPFLSCQPVPYLSGDLMIMLFAANTKENIKKVVFTIESGLSIGKFLKKVGINYEEVTVGDRAIADYISTNIKLTEIGTVEPQTLIGGEPSGHMMFGKMVNGKMLLIDDPIMTQLKIIGLMRKTGKDFDTLVREIIEKVEEAYTARKPDAWAGEPNCKGVSLSEKIKLELRLPGKGKVILTEYARQFIPECFKFFSDGYIEAYYKNIPENRNKYPEVQKSIVFSEEYNKFLKAGKSIKGPIEYLYIGRIDITTKEEDVIEKIKVKLRLTSEDWAGPSDINLSFYAGDKSEKFCLAGGVVSRNSGTSPKNSAYNKLWFVHYPTGYSIKNEIIKRVTTQMAEKRAEFTNRFVERLRDM